MESADVRAASLLALALPLEGVAAGGEVVLAHVEHPQGPAAATSHLRVVVGTIRIDRRRTRPALTRAGRARRATCRAGTTPMRHAAPREVAAELQHRVGHVPAHLERLASRDSTAPVARRWLYAAGDSAKYDRARALFPEDVLAWVQQAHPAAWAALQKHHGSGAGEALLSRLRDQLNTRGTLEVLRHGIEMMGLKARLPLAQFRPAMAANDEIRDPGALRRQPAARGAPGHHSVNNPQDSMDLVLFLNGVPVATAELKTDFTQSVGDAVDQYRLDRNPRPAGKLPEPLLSFPGGALVHFAVSNHEVHMTTRLEGPPSRFLPFNRGNQGGKGNEPTKNGYPTSYLWE